MGGGYQLAGGTSEGGAGGARSRLRGCLRDCLLDRRVRRHGDRAGRGAPAAPGRRARVPLEGRMRTKARVSTDVVWRMTVPRRLLRLFGVA